VAQILLFNCATESKVMKMSPRTGRPKSKSPKTIEVKARIDEKTNEKLNLYCEKYSVTRTDVVRMGIDEVLGKEKE
jgi:hypothetical protein